MPTIALVAHLACIAELKVASLDTGLTDTGRSSLDTDAIVCDPGSYVAPSVQDALWCIDFEDGALDDVGYPGASDVTLWDGARVLALGEGQDISALNGEECVGFAGDWGVALRSDDDGDPASVAIVTTPVFTVEASDLFWSVLNEVDERGIYWALDVQDADGLVLASAVLPSSTGGHVPGLNSEQALIPDIPEIGIGLGTPGELVEQAVDLSPWHDESVRLRFYQHTVSPGNGFLTLLDQICAGTPPEHSERITLGDPLDHGV